MALRMEWGWTEDGLAGANFATVEEAVESLTSSVERATVRYGSVEHARILRECVTPMRTWMLAEGAQALAEGRDWSGECGGLIVRLTPRE